MAENYTYYRFRCHHPLITYLIVLDLRMSFSIAAVEKDIIKSSTGTTKRVNQAMSQLYILCKNVHFANFSAIAMIKVKN